MSAMIDIKDLVVSYDGMRALQGVSMHAQPGALVALVGANGAGKSSLLRAISGLVRPQAGLILLEGSDLIHVAPHDIVRRGVAHVPEGRRVFATASVHENLLLGAHVLRDRQQRERLLTAAFEAFPRLKERREQKAGTLSGGEQQMLAIARGTMSAPKLMMLDEPSLGIAPILIPQILAGVKRIAAGGTTVLLVEQKLRDALQIADYGYVLQTGRVVLEGTADMLLGSELVQKAYLGL